MKAKKYSKLSELIMFDSFHSADGTVAPCCLAKVFRGESDPQPRGW